MTPGRVWGLTFLWMCFGFYGTIFPPASMVAGTFIQKGSGDWGQFAPIAYQVLAPLPFLQSLGFGFVAAATHDLMAKRHYPGDLPTFCTILIVSILLVAIGFYSAVASAGIDENANAVALVKMQAVLTMAGIGVATLLKFSELSA